MSSKYNLLEESWIPVITKNGDLRQIAPWQITEEENSDNPIIEIASPRPDYDGVLIQFLIGLIQVAFPPCSEQEIVTREREFISPEELKKSLEKYRDAFYLSGNGFRFMQEKALANEDKRTDISQILIEYPGENTEKENRDHFIHRGRIRVLCPSCVASALFCLQINGAAGGSGHRTSLRGGGPLTTIIKGPTVWKTVCRNLLTRDKLNLNGGDPEKRDLKYIFPWMMVPAINSEKGKTTVPDDMSPFHGFWSMPKRIYLFFEEKEEECSFCGEVSDMVCSKYIQKTKGINYGGSWKHPLTPYRKDNNELISLKPQSGGFSYRYWIGWIQKDNKTSPAKVVDNFLNYYRYRDIKEFPRIKGFGYDMDNAKALCWYEGEMPVIWIEEQYSARYQSVIAQFIETAQYIVGQLVNAIKKVAIGKIGNDNKWKYGKSFGTSSIREESSSSFWKETEPFFYESLLEIRKSLLKKVDVEEIDEIKLDWLKEIRNRAIKIFDIYSSDGNYDAIDPYKIVRARNELERFTSSSSKKIEKVLGIVTKEA